MGLAIATSVATVGCPSPPTTPGIVVLSDCIDAKGPTHEVVPRIVDRYYAIAARSETDARKDLVHCTARIVMANAKLGPEVATALVEPSQGKLSGSGAAIELLELSADSVPRVEAYTRVSDFARSKGDYKLAHVALDKAITVSFRVPGAVLLQPSLRGALADLDWNAGDKDEAIRVWRDLATSSPDETEAARQTARALAAVGKQAEADRLCDAFSTQKRDPQARACFQAAPLASDDARRSFLSLYARTPTVTKEDYDRLTGPRGNERYGLPGASQCAAGQTLHIQWVSLAEGAAPVWRGSPVLPNASVYEKLSEAAPQPGAAKCFRASGAASCVQQLRTRSECDDTSVLARYAEMLLRAGDRDSKQELREFATGLFDVKLGLYQRIRRDGPRSAWETLLHLHLALAAIYTKVPGDNDYERPEYHVRRAREIWTFLTQRPLPSELLPQELRGMP